MVKQQWSIITVALIACLVLAACAAPAPAPAVEPAAAAPATEAPAATEVPAATEAPAATEVVAPAKCVKIANYETSGEKSSMDPSILYSGGDAPYIYGVYERLVDVTPNFEVVPELAESWESNADATEWTFHLRSGVKFHDGTELTAKDVVYTFRRILDPATGSSGLGVLSASITPDGITAKDNDTVVFKTAEPAVMLPLLLTTKETGIVRDGAKSEDLRVRGNGTGPFMQDTFTPGSDYIKLVANPSYWQAGMPKAPCLEIRTIQEATTATAALQSGEQDLILQVDSAAVTVLKGDANISLLETAAGNSMTFSMFTDTPPFDNVKVRQALKKVIDRKEMVQTVLLGLGEAGADNPIPVSDPLSYLNSQGAPVQDIEGAKKLLVEAGYSTSKPLKFDLYTGEGVPGVNLMSQVFAEQAAKAGIQVNIIQTPSESFWDDVWLKQSFVTSAWSRRPVILAEGMAYKCDSKYPETHWCRPEFDKLVAKAGSTVDPKERADTLHQMQQMITEDGGVIVPMFVHSVSGLRANCSGWLPHVQNFNHDWSQITCK